VGSTALRIRRATPASLRVENGDRRSATYELIHGVMGGGVAGEQYAEARGRLFNEIVRVMDIRRREEGYPGLGATAKKELRAAYQFAIEAHREQFRGKPDGLMTRVPYIFHTLIVAYEYATVGGDYKGVIAGMLHDAIEQGRIRGRPISLTNIENRFGAVVADYVDRQTPPKLVDGRWVWANAPNYANLRDEYRERRADGPSIENEMLNAYWDRVASDPTTLVLKILDFRSNLEDIDNLPPDRKDRYFRKVASKMGILRILHPPLYAELYGMLEERGYAIYIPQAHPSNRLHNCIVVAPRRERIVAQKLVEDLPMPGQDNTMVYTNGARDVLLNGWLELGCPRRINGNGRKPRPLLRPLAKVMDGMDITPGTSQLPTGMELSELIYRVEGVGKGEEGLTLEHVQDTMMEMLESMRTFHAENISNGRRDKGYAADGLPRIVFIEPDESLRPVIDHFTEMGVAEVIEKR